MKILIIAHDFPPINRVAALRPYSWAKYWSLMGHDITVITSDGKQVNAPLDLKNHYLENIQERVNIKAIKYLPIKASNDNSTNTTSQTQSYVSNWYQLAKNGVRRFSNWIGSGSLLAVSLFWILPAYKTALKIYKQWQFDIIVSTYPPPAAHLIASLLKTKLDIFWVADYRDLWHGVHSRTEKALFSYIQKQLENNTVSKADLITTVSYPLSHQLTNRFGNKTIVIENGFDLDDLFLIQKSDSYFPEDGKVRLGYTGKIHSVKQDPSPLFEAINYLEKHHQSIKPHLELIFYSLDHSEIRKIAQKYNLQDILNCQPYVERDKILKIQSSLDALIFLDWNDPNVEGIFTGKLFEYLYSGTPILGISATPNTVAGKLIKDAGVGVCLGNSVEQIAQTLLDLVYHQGIEYSPSQDVLQRYSREHLAKKILNEIINQHHLHYGK